MKKCDILQELYDSRFVTAYVKTVNKGRYSNDLIEDIIQDIWVIICELSEDKLCSLYAEGGIGKVKKFCSGIICRQVNSVTSSVYKSYKMHSNKVVMGGDVGDIIKGYGDEGE